MEIKLQITFIFKKMLVWCGMLMANIFTCNSTNVINCTILPVLQDYSFLYYQVYDRASNQINDD